MAKNKCVNLTREVEYNVNAKQRAFAEEVKRRLDDFMGTKAEAQRWYGSGDKLDPIAMKAWLDLRRTMLNHTMEMAMKLDYSGYDLDERLSQISDYIQSHLKSPIIMHSKDKRTISHRRIMTVSTIVNGLINLQQTRLGKKLNSLERAFLPVTAFAMKADPLGTIYGYAKKITQLAEQARNRTAQWRGRHNAMLGKYRENLENVIGNHEGLYDESWTMGGIKVADWQGHTVTFIATHRNEDGSVYHNVLIDGKPTKLDEDAISTVEIRRGLVDAYAHGLLDDILHGQTRYVTWHNAPLSAADAKQIAMYGKELGMRAEKGEEFLKQGMQEIHSISDRKTGVKYRFIMLHNGTSWDAYLISHTTSGKNPITEYYYSQNGTRKENTGVKVEDLKHILRDGFYKATEWRSFGNRYVEGQGNKSGYFVNGRDRGWFFGQDVGKQGWMKVQPRRELAQIGEEQEIGLRTDTQVDLRGTVYDMRALFFDIGKVLSIEAQKEQGDIDAWISEGMDKKSRLSKLLEKHLGKEITNSALERIKETFDIGNQIFIDDDGNVHTPNAYFQMIGRTDKRGGNVFAPTIYEDSQLNVMLDNQLKDMIRDQALLYDQTTNTYIDEVKYDELDKTIKEFKLTIARRERMLDKAKTLEGQLELEKADEKTVLARRAVHTKHISGWTDLSMRMRERDVFDKYIQDTFYSIEKNRILVDMLNSMEQVLTAGTHQADIVNWMTNRTKVAFLDPTAEAKVASFDISNQRFADFLNKIPFTGRKWTAETASQLLLTTKGGISMMLLGSRGALTNRTQVVNDVIAYGIDKWRRSADALENPQTNAKWMAIIDNAGTDEIISMFMDHMASLTDLTWRDPGMLKIPLLPVQIPTAKMVRYVKFAMRNRDKFIKGLPELKELDDFLNTFEVYRIKRIKDVDDRIDELQKKLELTYNPVEMGGRKVKMLTDSEIKKIKKDLAMYKKEELAYKNNKERRNIKALRETFIDLLLTPKGEQKSVLEARYKRLVGRVSDDRAKKFIAWKLGWWPTSFGKEMFTFTGGEQLMRRQTAIMALLTADEQGLLGSDTDEVDYEYTNAEGKVITVKIGNRFLTDTAVRVARNAVNDSMFGMSAPYLGDAFLGLGGHFGLYKAYPLQQMLFDMRMTKRFFAGGTNFFDNIDRLKDAAAYLMSQGLNGTKYDITNSKLDHDAIATVRFLLTRVAMSGIVIAQEIIPFMRVLVKSPFSGQLGSMIRGGENPGLAIITRLLFNVLLFASADDDNFERDDELIWDIARLFFPVFLTWPVLWAQQMIED